MDELARAILEILKDLRCDQDANTYHGHGYIDDDQLAKYLRRIMEVVQPK